MSHVARRCTYHQRSGVLLGILAHVEADEGIFLSEHLLGEALGEIGLAYACRAEEEERTDRSARVSQSESRPTDSFHHLTDSLVLTDDA